VLKRLWQQIFQAKATENGAALCPLRFDRRSRRRLLWQRNISRNG
jgi:hypothetical protein